MFNTIGTLNLSLNTQYIADLIWLGFNIYLPEIIDI